MQNWLHTLSRISATVMVLTASTAFAQSDTNLSVQEKQAAEIQWQNKALPKIQARGEAVNAILRAVSWQLARLSDPVMRSNELALNLHKLSDAQLTAAAGYRRLVDLDAFLNKADGLIPTQAALGDQVNLVFTPITPCRIADSRESSAGILQQNVARAYKNWSAPGQGGTASCNGSRTPGLLAGTPSALALTITATQAAREGHITLSPHGETGVTSVLNVPPGVNIANTTVVKSAGGGADTFDFDITPAMPVHVVVDLLGFYAASEPAALDCVNVRGPNATIAAGSGSVTITAPACTAGYTQTATFCESNNRGVILRDVALDQCQYDQGTVASFGFATARCCRVPGTNGGRF